MSKKNKKDIKDKKLLKMRNSNIKFNKIEDDEKININIEIDILIAPAERPRKSSGIGGLYDPLKNYKIEFQNKLKKFINFEPYEGEIDVSVIMEVGVTESWSNTKKYNALTHRIKPTSKPDNDNVEKTIFDTFNKLIWVDDSHIINNKTTKYYTAEDRTLINIIIYKNNNDIIKGRLNKKQLEELEQCLTKKK